MVKDCSMRPRDREKRPALGLIEVAPDRSMAVQHLPQQPGPHQIPAGIQKLAQSREIVLEVPASDRRYT